MNDDVKLIPREAVLGGQNVVSSSDLAVEAHTFAAYGPNLVTFAPERLSRASWTGGRVQRRLMIW